MKSQRQSELANHLPLAAILLLAAGIRIALTLEHSRSPLFTFLRLDEIIYDDWARSAMSGEWFLDYVPNHSPLYPWVLAALYKIFGYNLWLPRLFAIFLGLASTVLVNRISRRLFGETASLVSAFLFALYWPLMIFEQRILAEPLFLFLNLAGLLFAVRAVSRDSFGEWAGAGLMIGMATITRPTSGPWLVVLIAETIYLAIKEKKLRRLFSAGLVIIFAALPIAPVLFHNHRISRDWILQMNGGLNLYLGNNPEADGAPYARPGGSWDEVQALPYHEAGLIDPADQDRFYMRKVWSFIKEDPLAFGLLQFHKMLLLFNHQEIRATIDPEFHRSLFRVLSLPMPGFAIIFIVAFFGLRIPSRSNKDLVLFDLYIWTYALVLLSTVIASRYRLPFTAGLTILAGGGFSVLISDANSIKNQWNEEKKFPLKKAFWPIFTITAVFTLTHFLVPPSNFQGMPALFHVLEAPSYTSSEELAYLGDAWFEKGDMEKARENYQSAMLADSKNSLAMMGMARLVTQRGDLPAGIKWIEQAAVADPKSSRAHFALGMLLLKQDQKAEALRELKRAVDCRPLWVQGLYQLAELEQQMGWDEDARRHLALIQKLRPGLQLSPPHSRQK